MKQNYLRSLLGNPAGQAAQTTVNNSTALQIVPPGFVLPLDQINDKIHQFKTTLQQPITNLANVLVTIKNIGTNRLA